MRPPAAVVWAREGIRPSAARRSSHFVTDPVMSGQRPARSSSGRARSRWCMSGNTAVHVQDHEADAKKRAFTRAELHGFFAYCDDQVGRIRAFGRKGWLPAFRDAALLETRLCLGA